MAHSKTVPNISRKEGIMITLPIDATFAATTGNINAGDILVFMEETGYVKPAYITGTAKDRFAGVCAETTVAGATEVNVYVTGIFYFYKTTPAVTDLALMAYGDVADNKSAQHVTCVAKASPVAKAPRVGIVVDYTTFSGKVGVLITGFVDGTIAT